MKYGKSFFLSIAASAAVVLTGCGAGSSADSTGADAGVNTPAAVITVERGPVLDANVTDANGTRGHELGNGQYAFDDAPQYPITAIGGYIDVNRNGKIDAGEVKNTLKLQAKAGDVVTIATTLAEDKNVSELLETAFDLKPEDIKTKTPGMDKKVEALSNMVYAYAMEHNVSDLSDFNATQLMAMKEQFHETVQNYKDDAKDAAEHEEALMQRLQIPTLDDADAQQVQQKIEGKLKKQQHEAEDTASSAMNELQEKVQDHAGQDGDWQNGTDDMMDGIKDKLQTHTQENGDSASSAMNELQERIGDMFGDAGGKGDAQSGMTGEGAASSEGGMMNGHGETENENDMGSGAASSVAQHADSSASPMGDMDDKDDHDTQQAMSQSGASSSMGSHTDAAADEAGQHGPKSEDSDAETMRSSSSASAGYKGGFSAF